MATADRVFVVCLTSDQAEQIRRGDLREFDTQVPHDTASPATGRFTVLVETSRQSAGWRIFGVAVVKTVGSGGSFHRRLRARSVIPLIGDLLDETVLRSELAKPVFELFAAAVRGQAGELTEARSATVLDVLRRYSPDAVAAIEAAISPQRINSTSAGRWQHEADAIRLVLHAAGLDTALTWRPPAPEAPFLAGLVGEPHEATLIDNDMRMPGWQALMGAGNRPDIRVFSDGERRVEILNANATRAEQHYGVDLIYYLAPAQSLVMVQYKKLANDVCSVDSRFEGQLARMREVAKLGSEASDPRGYRLGSRTSCFVKLARAREFDPTADSMMQGMYLPLGFVDLLLSSGGKTLGYRTVERHLNNRQFIALLSDGWIGTTGVSMEDLSRLAAESVNSGSSLVLARDSGGPSVQRRWRGRQ